MRTHWTRWVTLQSGFAFAALLAVAAAQAQQTITIQAANSVNNQIYGVSFGQPPTTTPPLNNDQSSLLRLESLVFFTNLDPDGAFTLDLLAADNANHQVLRYTGDFTNGGGFSCPPPNTSGPPCQKGASVLGAAAPIRYPNGLSVDGVGDVFLVDDAPGKSPLPQVWALLTDGHGGFQTPTVPIDDNSSTGSLTAQQAVVETMVVAAPLGNSSCGQPPCAYANTGDLLVVSNNPDAILLYPAAGLNGKEHPRTLIRQCSKPHGDSNCIPGGSVPQGIALWPADNTLLITVSGGSILRFSLNGGTVTQVLPTLTGLPGGLIKIKTAITSGGPLGFVAQSGQGNHGSILELGSCANNPGIPGCINNPLGPLGIALLASVTSGVAAPQAVAVTTQVQGPASSCQLGLGCNFLGGQGGPNVLTHLVQGGSLQGNLIEDVCIVPADQSRPILPGHSGVCNDAPLPVNQVCAGFDNTGSLSIPGYLCGGSKFGTSNTAFALVKTLTTHAQNSGNNFTSEWNGTYVGSSADTGALFPPASADPQCGPGGTATLVWAPLLNEGTIAEGSSMVDITSGCGTGHGGSGYTSLWAIGLALDTTATELQGGGNTPLENFAQNKYTNLISTVSAFQQHGNITNATVSSDLHNNSNNGCIDISQADFQYATSVDVINTPQWTADMQNAANLLTSADTINSTTCNYVVTNNLGSFQEKPQVLNPSGQIQSRLGNLYYTINTLILGNATSGSWPQPISVSANPTVMTSTSGATIYYKFSAIANTCSLTSSDGAYSSVPLAGSSGSYPITQAPQDVIGTPVAYTITCTVPGGTMTPPGPQQGNEQTSATAYVTPVASLSATAASGTPPSSTLSWSFSTTSQCVLTSSDGVYTANTAPNPLLPTAPPPPNPLGLGSGSQAVTPNFGSPAAPVSYTMTCTVPARTGTSPVGSASATVSVSPP